LRCKTSAGRAGMPGARHASAGLSGLDLQREHELLALVVSGLLNKQIAAKLGTTEGAVSHSC
jgi:DNA-binding NarL/FixJ family response regulator